MFGSKSYWHLIYFSNYLTIIIQSTLNHHKHGLTSFSCQTAKTSKILLPSCEAPTHWVPSDSVFFMPSGGRLGCSSTAAVGHARQSLLVWWCLPLCFPVSGESLLWFRYKQECGYWVEAAVCVYLLCRRLCVELGRVDVPLQPTRDYSRAVTRVDVLIQPGKFVFISFPAYDLPGS
jgi:hypothetical protein